MSDMIWLSAAQMCRIEPYFPLSHGVPRVDDRRVISGIIFVIKNGLRWRDAPKEYGPHKTIYNRFIRWSRLGVFNQIFAALAAKCGKSDRLMIDATHLKAHCTVASLQKKGCSPPHRTHQRRNEIERLRVHASRWSCEWGTMEPVAKLRMSSSSLFKSWALRSSNRRPARVSPQNQSTNASPPGAPGRTVPAST